MRFIRYGENLSVLYNTQHFTVASWAPIRGGIKHDVHLVYNATINENLWEATPEETQDAIKSKLADVQLDFNRGVGMLTAVPQIYCGHSSQTNDDGLIVNCFATAGIDNGSLSDAFDCVLYNEEKGQKGPEPHTINVICWVNRNLTNGALLEALNQINYAKMTVLIERGFVSPNTGNQALCTGTDCSAMCCINQLESEITLRWAGPFSVLGRMITETSYSAIQTALSHKYGTNKDQELF
jgi:adenosylcobinamide amidohydrolase